MTPAPSPAAPVRVRLLHAPVAFPDEWQVRDMKGGLVYATNRKADALAYMRDNGMVMVGS